VEAKRATGRRREVGFMVKQLERQEAEKRRGAGAEEEKEDKPV